MVIEIVAGARGVPKEQICGCCYQTKKEIIKPMPRSKKEDIQIALSALPVRRSMRFQAK